MIGSRLGKWILDRELGHGGMGHVYLAHDADQPDNRAAESYLCSCEPRAHFGLGEATRVDAVEIVWPDGSREAFPGCAVDQRLEVRKGEGRAAADR